MGEEAPLSDLETKVKRRKIELTIAEKELEVAKHKKALLDLENIEKTGEAKGAE